MTFEEWYKENKSPNEYIGNVYLKDRYKLAWNAAIASVDASLDSLADAGGDITWHSLDLKLKDLKKLLTA